MKIQLPIEDGYFNVKSVRFCGLEAYLITPEIDAKWNINNLFYRSLIVDKDGEVLSSGWPKFFNYGEKPECYPKIEEYNDIRFIDKIDGSLVICDYVNEQFSMRTRGTASYNTLPNAKDFELLLKKHPKVLDVLKDNQHLSLLFEIVTPNNVIVVRPKEVEFYFIGAINKNGMVIVSNQDLTNIWRKIGPVPVPKSYEFNNFKNLSEIAGHIKNWKGKEGIVISYNNNQNRIKLKSDWYLFIHRVKSELNSENNLIEYYVESNMPDKDEFAKKIETDFDFEIAEQLKDLIIKICKAGEKTKQDIENMKDFVHSIRGFENRKQKAEHINITYGHSNRSSFVFNLLDGKELSNSQFIKLINQNIKLYE
jgi:hypothetical protein